MRMNAGISLLAAVSGYLAGSIPFAILVMRTFGKGQKLEETSLPVRGTDEAIRSSAVSATAVRLQLGSRYGCLTSILDMAKAAGVTVAFKLAYPGDPFFLVASGFAVVGHIWPIFHAFRGGRGQSPAIGGLFVVDWPTPLLIYPLAQGLGILTRSRGLVGRFAPMLIASAWLWIRFRDFAFVYYGLGLFLVRVIAMRDEIQQYQRLRRDGHLRSLSDEVAMLGFDKILQGWHQYMRRFLQRLRRSRDE
jgi:acyl phosphate:glycerol-3-phosphate acyltransferase